MSVAEVSSLMKRAFVFTFPWCASYHTMGKMTADPVSGEPFRVGINEVVYNDRVFTAADRTMPMVNSSNFTSLVWFDLRGDAVVVTVPASDDPDRYYSFMQFDSYHYISTPYGSRLGNVALERKVLFHSAFSAWDGVVPDDVDEVVEMETAFGGCGLRLGMNPSDADNLAAASGVLHGLQATTLRANRGQPSAERTAIDWVPIGDDYDDMVLGEHYFDIVKLMAQQSTPHPNDADEWDVLEQLGLGASGGFDTMTCPPETLEAMRSGVAEALADLSATPMSSAEGLFKSRAEVAGTEADYYAKNAKAAYFGFIGQPNYEVTYLITTHDASGDELEATDRSYTIRYERGQLPPVDAFWAYTLYDLPAYYLYDNASDKYTVDSMQGYVLASDGSLTIHISHHQPESVPLTNWLPAPQGPFVLNLRLYNPAAEVLDGTWTEPPTRKL